ARNALAQRDELQREVTDKIRRLENVTNQAFELRKQRDDLLSALRESESQFKYIRDFAKSYKTVKTFVIISAATKGTDEASAAIANAEKGWIDYEGSA